MFENVNQSVYSFQKECTHGFQKEKAFEYYGNNIQYPYALKMIENVAKMLKSYDVNSGDVVAVVSPMIPEVIYSFYGINKIGAVFFPIDPRTNADRIKEFLKLANIKVVIMLDQAYLKVLNCADELGLKKVIVVSVTNSMRIPVKTIYQHNINKVCKKFYSIISKYSYDREKSENWQQFDGIKENEAREYCTKNKAIVLKNWYYDHSTPKVFIDWKIAIKSVENNPNVEAVYDETVPATLTLTSGTTGMPKLVPTKNKSYNVKIRDYYNTTMPIAVGDRILSMPPFILYGEVFMHMAFCRGVQNIIIPDITQYEYSDVILKKKVSHAVGVPSQMLSFCNNRKFIEKKPVFLKTVSVGGTRMLLEHERQINKTLEPLGIKVTQGYSMSELTPSSFTNTPNNVKETSVGRPLGDTRAIVVDSTSMTELGVGQEGELLIHSETQFEGYYKNEIESKKVLVEHKGITYVKTGDTGSFDEDGYFYIKGRSKEMIIRPDGHNVFPSELEDIISQHSGIKDCAVVGVPYPNYDNPIGEYPKAHISIKKDEEKDVDLIIDELKKLCAMRLPERDVPYYYEIHESIPLTGVLKPDKLKLREMDKESFMKNNEA